MADNNSYTSKQNVKKYTTQAKFDAIDKSDVPVGTEYNIVGKIEEADLSAELQAKVNLTGDNLTTEVTGGKVKVKNPMTSTGGNGFKLNSFYNATTGVTYFFPIETPIGHFATGIVPILGSVTGTKPGSTAPATYQGVFLPNGYSENNYGPNAYGMLTMSESHNSGSQIYILPYCPLNPGVSHLLSEYSITPGPGIAIRDTTSGQSTPVLEISYAGSGGGYPTPEISRPYQALIMPAYSSGSAQWVEITEGKIKANYIEYNPGGTNVFDNVSDGTIYHAIKMPEDGGSGYTRFVLLAPTAPSGTGSTILNIPNKGGTLATLDDIPTGGGSIAATELNETPSSTKTITLEELKALDTGFYNASNCILKGDADLPRGYYHLIKIKAANETDGSLIAQDHDTGDTYVLTFRLSGSAAVGWSIVVYTHNLPIFKTLFGDQSIEGEGNIDLYKHIVTITGEADSQGIGDTVSVEGYIIFYSSKNLDCNSLTDLKTVLGDTFIEKAFGYVTRPTTGDIWAIDYVTETYVYFSGTTSSGQDGKATVPFTMEIVDNVTTI